MKIQRTANAGILLTLDGVKILMDGVCPNAHGYLGTPDPLRKELTENLPDVYAYTHIHTDHYDPVFAAKYRQAGGVIIGPEDGSVTVGGVTITAIPARHIGKTDCPHAGYVVQGSKCLWFTGDSTPVKWKNRMDLPKPDVVAAPYAYAIASGWEIAKSLNADKIVILHLPDGNNDPYDLWGAVTATVANSSDVVIPAIGEYIEI